MISKKIHVATNSTEFVVFYYEEKKQLHIIACKALFAKL